MFINKQPRVEGLQFVVCARAGQYPRKIMRCGVCPVGFTGRRWSLGCQKFMRDQHLWRKREGSIVEQSGNCHANDEISTPGQGALASYPSKWSLSGGTGWAFVPPASFGHKMRASSGRPSGSLWITQPLNELMAGDGLLPSLPCWAVSSPFRETWGVHLWIYHPPSLSPLFLAFFGPLFQRGNLEVWCSWD